MNLLNLLEAPEEEKEEKINLNTVNLIVFSLQSTFWKYFKEQNRSSRDILDSSFPVLS